MEWYYICLLVVGALVIIYCLLYLIHRIHYRYDYKLIKTCVAFRDLKLSHQRHQRGDEYDRQYYDYMNKQLKNLGIVYYLTFDRSAAEKVTCLTLESDVMGQIYSYEYRRAYFHKKLTPLYDEIINIIETLKQMENNEKNSEINEKENLIDEYMNDFNTKTFTVHRKLKS